MRFWAFVGCLLVYLYLENVSTCHVAKGGVSSWSNHPVASRVGSVVILIIIIVDNELVHHLKGFRVVGFFRVLDHIVITVRPHV